MGSNKLLMVKFVLLIVLFNFAISHVEADGLIDGVFSWFKVQWSKTKKEVKSAIDKITPRSLKEDGEPERPQVVVTMTTTTMMPKTNRPERRKSDICGLSKYSKIANRVRRYDDAMADFFRQQGLSPPVSMRISGGRSSKVNELPWQVRILINKGEFCGATLLNSRTIITAAHCTENPDVTKYRIYLADHSLRDFDEGEQTVQIAKIIRHPRYDASDTWSNDFALLITATEIPMSAIPDDDDDLSPVRIRPICMPSEGSFLGELGGLRAVISGWGHFDSRERAFSRVLKVANVTVVNHAICKNQYARFQKLITSEMLCAGFESAKNVFVDSCQGDSGGGMITLHKGRQTLIGVTSFGLDCNNKEKIPGVYARITTALGWIQAHAVGPLHYYVD